MSHLIPFVFETHQFRSLIDDKGDPWFVAMDVAEILDYSETEKMTRRLDEDEKQNSQIGGFGPRGVTLINLPGLFNAVQGSQKPEAKRFSKWVRSDVLPTLFKTGSYSLVKPKVPELPPPSHTDRVKYEDILRRCYAQLDKTEFFAVSVREGLRNQICEVLELLDRPDEAARFRQSFDVYPPFQKVFWDLYQDLEDKGMAVNHCQAPNLIGINIKQFQKACAKLNCPTYPDGLYRKYLPYSEGKRYLGEQHVESRIYKTPTYCLLFERLD